MHEALNNLIADLYTQVRALAAENAELRAEAEARATDAA